MCFVFNFVDRSTHPIHIFMDTLCVCVPTAESSQFNGSASALLNPCFVFSPSHFCVCFSFIPSIIVMMVFFYFFTSCCSHRFCTFWLQPHESKQFTIYGLPGIRRYTTNQMAYTFSMIIDWMHIYNWVFEYGQMEIRGCRFWFDRGRTTHTPYTFTIILFVLQFKNSRDLLWLWNELDGKFEIMNVTHLHRSILLRLRCWIAKQQKILEVVHHSEHLFFFIHFVCVLAYRM